MIDGTFKSVPYSFTQLVSIHGYLVSKTYPLAFILLKTKQESAYKNAFQHLKRILQYDPVYIITDFEWG